jgi:hypothetical protein
MRLTLATQITTECESDMCIIDLHYITYQGGWSYCLYNDDDDPFSINMSIHTQR